jgi:two-component system LytT family response regulator
MSLTCIIIDDEPAAIIQVSFLLGKYAQDWTILGFASDITSSKKLLETYKPDVIFSDIHFGDEVIFDVLPELKLYKGSIVFISGDNGFASQAFELSAVNYLLKPLDEERFAAFVKSFNVDPQEIPVPDSIQLLYHNISEKKLSLKKMSFPTKTGYSIKEMNEIIYAKSESNYTLFHLKDGEKILATKTLLYYDQILEEFGFFRIHQSYLINLNFLLKFDSENLQVEVFENDLLPVSIRRKSALMERIKGVF